MLGTYEVIGTNYLVYVIGQYFYSHNCVVYVLFHDQWHVVNKYALQSAYKQLCMSIFPELIFFLHYIFITLSQGIILDSSLWSSNVNECSRMLWKIRHN